MRRQRFNTDIVWEQLALDGEYLFGVYECMYHSARLEACLTSIELREDLVVQLKAEAEQEGVSLLIDLDAVYPDVLRVSLKNFQLTYL